MSGYKNGMTWMEVYDAISTFIADKDTVAKKFTVSAQKAFGKMLSTPFRFYYVTGAQKLKNRVFSGTGAKDIKRK
jgi:hypothetical protein